MSCVEWNEVYRILIFCLLQYGITEWLLDIQNKGTLTGEKLKKKIVLLKPYSSSGQVCDDLTTANMDPWGRLHPKV